MKRLNQWLLIAALGLITAVSSNAQDTNAAPSGDNNSGGRGGRNRGSFDPSRFQQMIMDNLKEKLEVKDDTEWKALEPLIQKVMDARRETMSGLGRGMFGRGSRPGGDNNGGGDSNSGRRGGPFGQTSSPEADALEKAIEAKATKSELKDAIAKYQEARKVKQADLEKAQENLRKVLTVRQEAIATSAGLL